MFNSVCYTGSSHVGLGILAKWSITINGDVNFGPLIDPNKEDFCPAVKETTIAKSPLPVESSLPHSTQHNSDGTVDPVLKAITAPSVGLEKQNSALEDRFGELSKRLDALESKQPDCHVTLGTNHHKSDIPDLFGDLRKSVLVLFQHLFLLAHIASFLNNERRHVSIQSHTVVQLCRRIVNKAQF